LTRSGFLARLLCAAVELRGGVAGIGDDCVGCKMSRQVGSFQRLGVV